MVTKGRCGYLGLAGRIIRLKRPHVTYPCVLAAKKRISSLSDIKTTPYLIALLLSSDMFRYERFILLRNYRDLYVFDAELNSIKHLRFAGVNTNNGFRHHPSFKKTVTYGTFKS